ncbi:MAG TPA: N-formylglutamate amidohydrolase [Alphaproteobacteria bacterium]
MADEDHLCPLFMDSPHSGTMLPPDFHYACDLADIRASQDTLVDGLIAGAPALGIGTLTAQFTRAYLDLNRSLADIDPALCAEKPDWPTHPSKRVQYGLGLIHTRARGHAIYDAPLPKDAINHRIDHYYKPYYACLEAQLQHLHDIFGHALHLNMHAMPSRSIDGKLLPDIVIGDLDGVASHRIWRDLVRDLFKQAGFVVSVNTPYKGVEIISRTGKPRQGVHALQIEINKALYLDEQTLLPHAGWEDCLLALQSVYHTLATILHDTDFRQAAE